MIELGKTQCLNIVKVTDFGVYLGTEEDKVLLPKKLVPDDVEVGDALTVFVYRDSSDRLLQLLISQRFSLENLRDLKYHRLQVLAHFLTGDLKKTCSCHTRNRQHMYQKAQSILLLSI